MSNIAAQNIVLKAAVEAIQNNYSAQAQTTFEREIARDARAVLNAVQDSERLGEDALVSVREVVEALRSNAAWYILRAEDAAHFIERRFGDMT